MSFGLSPTDVINLVQFSARVYVAFKDANDNSETQVAGFVREFSNFHECLVELSELMKEYGKPLPFPYLDFQQTLKRCEQTIEPYKGNLVDRKMSVKKFIYTIKYIGKEKEIENLRTQIGGHYKALQMCISFCFRRLHLEATKQTQRLLDMAPFRAISFGGQHYSTNAIGSSSGTHLALPAPSEADQLFKDWQIFSRWLKSEDERLALEDGSLSRPRSLGATPAVNPGGDEHTTAVVYHLAREIEDAIQIEENRAKRMAMEQRTHLLPSAAMRQEVRNLPPVPNRTYTLDSEHSGLFSRFDADHQLSRDSSATIQPASSSPLSTGLHPTSSHGGSPQIPASSFEPIDWDHSSPSSETAPRPIRRTLSTSTAHSHLSVSPGSYSSNSGPGISTAGTTPDNTLRRKMSATSLISIALGPGALQWNRLCHKVQVERVSTHGVETRVCDIQWRYREDAGISLRSLYRSSTAREVRTWVSQQFPATGPSIPLTTSFGDGDVSITFPRASFGKLDKGCVDIKYTLTGTEASAKFQTLLYTNNGNDPAELLYDRPVATISSNLNKPECRGKNLRLWKKKETRIGLNGLETIDVLVLLFYTSALPDEKAHWVEEPHYIFQWLDESVYKKSSDKLQLIVSKEPSKWSKDKVFHRRKSFTSSREGEVQDTGPEPGRRDTVISTASSSSVHSIKSMFAGGRSNFNAAGNLNRFGYSELGIKFQGVSDQKAFLEIWRKHIKQL